MQKRGSSATRMFTDATRTSSVAGQQQMKFFHRLETAAKLGNQALYLLRSVRRRGSASSSASRTGAPSPAPRHRLQKGAYVGASVRALLGSGPRCTGRLRRFRRHKGRR